jgi:hypothetical protein
MNFSFRRQAAQLVGRTDLGGGSRMADGTGAYLVTEDRTCDQ